MTHHPCDTQTDFHTSSSPAKTWRSHLPLRRQQGLLVVVRCLLLFLLAITITAGTALGTRVSHAGQIPCAGIECSTPTPGAKASPKVILEELKAAAYKDLMSGRTAPDGLPVLLDALLRHNRQDEVRGRGDRSLQELYNDEWTLANSYAVDHHVFLNGFVSDEADKLLHTPNVNWFANANMEWLWRQLQILQQNSAKSIIPGLVLAGRIEPEAPPSEVFLPDTF